MKNDKSALVFCEPKRTVDKKYRASARDRSCMVCGHGGAGSVVLAHISRSGNGIMGAKASDDESVWLCYRHHQEFDLGPDRDGWLVDNILLPARRRAYKDWRQS